MRIRIGGPVLVSSTNSETRKKIVKKHKRMLKRYNKHSRNGETRITNAFGNPGRTIYIGPCD